LKCRIKVDFFGWGNLCPKVKENTIKTSKKCSKKKEVNKTSKIPSKIFPINP